MLHDRECICDEGFEGIACQRLRCFNVSSITHFFCICPSVSHHLFLSLLILQDCNGHGQCLPEKAFAERAGYNYTIPWDAMKIWGCLCDSGYRGPDCSQRVRLVLVVYDVISLFNGHC